MALDKEGGYIMAFKKAQKITLSDLDRVSKEYESLLKTTEKNICRLGFEKG